MENHWQIESQVEGFKKRFSDKIEGNCQDKMKAEWTGFCSVIVVNGRNKNMLAKKDRKIRAGFGEMQGREVKER